MIKTNSSYFLNDLLKEISQGNIGISFHENADLDALASSMLIYELCMNFNLNCCIDISPGMAKEAKLALNEIKYEFKKCDNIGFNALIILDTAGLEQISSLKERRFESLILIDHHEEGELYKKSKLYYIDDSSSSTTEIVSHIIKSLNIKPSYHASTLAMLGILFDSNKFERASQKTFEIMEFLAKNGDYEKAISLYRKIIKDYEEDFSIRMAKIKGFSRASVSKICENLILVVTEVGSYESIVSNNLIQNGADIAFTIKHKDCEDSRISIRLSERALSKGLDAAKIAKNLGNIINGEGGGHKGAAIITTKNKDMIEKEKLFSYLINNINSICK